MAHRPRAAGPDQGRARRRRASPRRSRVIPLLARTAPAEPARRSPEDRPRRPSAIALVVTRDRRHPAHRRPRGRARSPRPRPVAPSPRRTSGPRRAVPAPAPAAPTTRPPRRAARRERRRRGHRTSRRRPSRGRRAPASKRPAAARPARQDPRRVRGLVGGLRGRGKVDDETWDELEEALLLADVGMPTTTQVLDAVAKATRRAKTADADARARAAAARSSSRCSTRRRATARCSATPGEPNVWMFVGVNGVGQDHDASPSSRSARSTTGTPSCSPPRTRSVPRPPSSSARGPTRIGAEHRPRPGGRRPRLGGVRRDERRHRAAAPISCSSTPPAACTPRST